MLKNKRHQYADDKPVSDHGAKDGGEGPQDTRRQHTHGGPHKHGETHDYPALQMKTLLLLTYRCKPGRYLECEEIRKDAAHDDGRHTFHKTQNCR